MSSRIDHSQEFHVGDLVRIREWDDMKAEFGLLHGGDGCIACTFGFYTSMCNLCGSQFVITHKNDAKVYGHETGWSISCDMIEHVNDYPIADEDMDGFMSMLSAQ